ncbi:uncharacterized protein ACB058_015441 isoform 2-T2 [Synchiropus picturatus]
MERSSSQKELRRRIVESLYELVHHFFSTISADQWTSLRTGNPDFSTKFKLAELLMNIVSVLSKSFLVALEHMEKVSEEQVLATVGSTVPQTFSQILNVEEEETTSDSTRNLVSLVGQEVTANVRSGLSVLPRGPSQNKEASGRLNEMIRHTCQMIKDFMSKVMCDTPPRRRTGSGKMKMGASSWELRVPTPREIPAPSPGDFLSYVADTVRVVMLREVHQVTDPLLGDLDGNTEPPLLDSEFGMVAKDVAQVLIKNRQVADSVCPCKSFLLKQKIHKYIKNHIRTFLGKYVLKALLRRCLAQIQVDLGQELSQESSRVFLAHLESLMVPEGDRGQNEAKVYKRIRALTSLRNAKILSDLMQTHLQIEVGSTDGTVTEDPRKILYVRVAKRVNDILVFATWWISTQASGHSERMARLLLDSPTLGVPPARDSEDPTDFTRVCLETLVEKLVSQIHIKTEINRSLRKPEITVKRLFDKTWAEVENLQMNISPDKFEKIVKTIFKGLCKRWGSADRVMVLIKLQDQELEDFIVSSFRRKLLKAK